MLYNNFPKYTHIVLPYLGYQDSYYSVISNKDGSITLNWESDLITAPSESIISNTSLAAFKAYRLKEIREEASKRILAKWPMWMQMNCVSGVYPESVLETYKEDVAAIVQASNTAEDSIDAATTIEQVEGVTVTWPTI